MIESGLTIGVNNLKNDVPRTNLYALSLDGVNDYVGGFPYLNQWSLNLDHTVEIWLKDFAQRTPAVRELVIFHSFWQFELNMNNQLRWRATYQNGAMKYLDYNFPVGFNKNQWTHFVFRYKASTRGREIFINNVVVASDTITANFNTGGSYIGLGATQSGSLFYKGLMDEYRVYQRWITNAEIAYSYNGGVANFPQNEQDLWYWIGFENSTENWGNQYPFIAPMFNFVGYPFIRRN